LKRATERILRDFKEANINIIFMFIIFFLEKEVIKVIKKPSPNLGLHSCLSYLRGCFWLGKDGEQIECIRVLIPSQKMLIF
jgi:hypothetical protein